MSINNLINGIENTRVLNYLLKNNTESKNLKNMNVKKEYLKKKYKDTPNNNFQETLLKAITIPKPPKGFRIMQASADNYCLYHSIVIAVKNSNVIKLSKIFNGFIDGYDLKDNIVKKLIDNKNRNNFNNNLYKNAIKEIWELLKVENISNKINSNKSKESLNKSNKINSNNFKESLNVNNRIDYILIINDIIKNLYVKLWGGGTLIKLITILYGFCINYYDYKNNTMNLVKPYNGIFNNDNNTIYLYYNLDNKHYDALIKQI